MAFTSIPGVGRLRASILSALITELRPLSAIKTSDEVVNNSSTLQNDDQLVVALTANAVYRLTVEAQYTAGTTADYKWAFTFPAGTTVSIAQPALWSTATAYTQAVGPLTSGTAVAAGGNGTGTKATIFMVGIVTVGGTAGNLQYQWAQNAATVEDTTTYAGSYLELVRHS